MCRFYTYKFQTCDHILTFHLLRCRQVGTDWTCNNNSVVQAERRVDGYTCNICMSPSTVLPPSIWLNMARHVLVTTEDTCGGTLNLASGQDAAAEIGSKGVMCGGLVPTLMIGEEFFNDSTKSMEQKAALLSQYVERYVEHWQCEFREPMRYLGYWKEKNQIFIDLAQRFLDPFKAVCTGLYRQELAVFDLNGMHELQIMGLQKYLRQHVEQTVAAANKRNKEEEAFASSDLAKLRLKNMEQALLLDPEDLYDEDVSVYDKGPGYRRSPRNHGTPMTGPRTPSARPSSERRKPPLTPRKGRTFCTPPGLKSTSEEQMDYGQVDAPTQASKKNW